MSQCKTCNAEIIWAKTASGKTMPIDAKSETMFIVEGGAGELVTCRPVQVRKSHFATCAQAEQHRRPREA